MTATLTHRPRFSLIVATVGRTEALLRLFESLASQSLQDFEVIVVDQSHDAAITERIASMADRMPMPYTTVVDDQRGLSRARNLGLKRASGQILVFPDDDCWYAPDLLQQVWERFETNPQCGVLAGVYGEPGRGVEIFPTRPTRLTLMNSFGRTASVGLFVHEARCHRFRLSFDERLGAGTALPIGEEVDIVLRLINAGVQVHYRPDIIVFHAVHRGERLGAESYERGRRSFGFIVGKNYPMMLATYKLARNLVSLVLRRPTAGRRHAVSALWSGFRDGRHAGSLTEADGHA